MAFSIKRIASVDVDFGHGLGKRNQARSRRRVASLLVFHADVADAKLQTGLDRVQDRALSDTALPGNDTVSPSNQCPNLIDPLTRYRRRQDDPIAELAPNTNRRLQVRSIDQVCFVDQNDGLNIGLLCRNQKPVNQVRFQCRLFGT